MGPLYARTLGRGGFEQLTIFGTPEQCRARLEPWYKASAALPVLFRRPNLTPEEIGFTLGAFRP